MHANDARCHLQGGQQCFLARMTCHPRLSRVPVCVYIGHLSRLAPLTAPRAQVPRMWWRSTVCSALWSGVAVPAPGGSTNVVKCRPQRVWERSILVRS